MYAYAVAFAGAEDGELLCLDHPLPFVAGEEVWFEEPRRREEGLVTTAHVLTAGVTGVREMAVMMPVAVFVASSPEPCERFADTSSGFAHKDVGYDQSQ